MNLAWSSVRFTIVLKFLLTWMNRIAAIAATIPITLVTRTNRILVCLVIKLLQAGVGTVPDPHDASLLSSGRRRLQECPNRSAPSGQDRLGYRLPGGRRRISARDAQLRAWLPGKGRTRAAWRELHRGGPERQGGG